MFQFYDVQLGDLTSVDLINPLKVLLFYRDTQTVVLLDNRLNENQRILLNELTPYRYFEHVKLAGERRLWLHDLDQNRLQLFNYINNTVVVSTPSLEVKIENLLTDYNFCHIRSSDKILSFNSYGSQTSELKIDENDMLGYDFENLVSLRENKLQVLRFGKDFRFRESENISNSSINSVLEPKSLYLKAGKLYLWDGKKVHIYPINPDKN